MCSTWLLAVFGAMPSVSAISALVMPSPMSRATSNSRDVSGRHGSSSEACPRAIRRSVSARSASDRRTEPVGRRAGRDGERRRPPRSGSSGPGTGPGRAAPRSPPRATVAVPAVDRRLEGDARDAGRAVGQRDQPPSVVERRAGDVRDPLEVRGACVEPGRGLGGPARLLRRPDAGHHERREQHALVDGGAPGQRVAAQRERPVGVAGLQGDLGQAPQGRQDELDLPARLAEGEGVGRARRSRRRARPGSSPRSPSAQWAIVAPRAAALVDDRLARPALGIAPDRRPPTTPRPGSSA